MASAARSGRMGSAGAHCHMGGRVCGQLWECDAGGASERSPSGAGEWTALGNRPADLPGRGSGPGAVQAVAGSWLWARAGLGLPQEDAGQCFWVETVEHKGLTPFLYEKGGGGLPQPDLVCAGKLCIVVVSRASPRMRCPTPMCMAAAAMWVLEPPAGSPGKQPLPDGPVAGVRASGGP